MYRILVIKLYFPLDALHVSDSLIHHHERHFYKPYIAIGICRYMPVQYVWLLCGYSPTTARRMVPAYTKCDAQLIKVAPDDGLKSPKHVEHLLIKKD